MNASLHIAAIAVSAILVLASSACGSSEQEDASAAIPTAIGCEDADKFQLQADASESVASEEDNYNGILQHRAEGIFWAVAVFTAHLKCSGAASSEADQLIVRALAEARKAGSEFDYRGTTNGWNKAVIILLQANRLLMDSQAATISAK
ncbi:MAG: hypothetical protein PVI21_01370 [Candidatus Woesebacteria bacterium]|jgi:hypothetical protein